MRTKLSPISHQTDCSYIALFLVLFCSPVVFGVGSNDSEAVSGISGIFLKPHEIMRGNKWSRPPLDVKSVERNVGRYDAIWTSELIAQCNRPAWEYLRRYRRDVKMFYNISGDTSRRTTESSYFDYDYINTYHPEWFLLADTREASPKDFLDPNKRIRVNYTDPTSSYYNRFYIDVGNEAFQRWAAKRLLARVSGEYDKSAFSHDGLLMDNVHIGSRRMQQITQRHPHWKYANDMDGWTMAFLAYLKIVKAELNRHGFILVVNHSMDYSSDLDQRYWKELYGCVDGILTEQSLRRGSLPYYTDDKWEASIKRHEGILREGLIDWWFCYPSESGLRAYDEFLYSYCSWLLCKQPERSFYHAKKGSHSYGNPEVPWYEEYDLPIGEPVGDRYPLGKCRARKYRNALMLLI